MLPSGLAYLSSKTRVVLTKSCLESYVFCGEKVGKFTPAQSKEQGALMQRCQAPARDAALLASPIEIPGVHFEKTQTLTIDLDPKAVLR